MSTALRPYRPVRTVAPAFVRRSDVGPLAWAGMLRDGAIALVDDGLAVPSGTRPTPALRLSMVAGLVPRRGVVGRGTAAWVHAGGPRPAQVDVLVRPGGRRADPHPGRRAAEGPLPDGDVLDLGTGRVTTVQRTGLDVARYLPRDEALRLLVALLPLGFDPAAALAAADDLPGGRGVQRARDALATVADAAAADGGVGWDGLRRGWPAGPASSRR